MMQLLFDLAKVAHFSWIAFDLLKIVEAGQRRKKHIIKHVTGEELYSQVWSEIFLVMKQVMLHWKSVKERLYGMASFYLNDV